MTDFYTANVNLRKECIQFITRHLENIEGQKQSLIDDALDPDEDDIYFDLPTAIYFDRNDYGITYAITNVRLEDGNIWFNGISTYDHSDEFSFGPNELETTALAEIADLLAL